MPPLPDQAPDVSILILAEVDPAVDTGLALRASIVAAAASLQGIDHEILIGIRETTEPEAKARLEQLLHEVPNCRLITDICPRPYPHRWEHLREHARGNRLLILAAGSIPLDSALGDLCETAQADTDLRMLRPRFLDASGQRLSAMQASASCLLIDSRLWPIGALAINPFRGPQLWDALHASAEREGSGHEHATATVVTSGWAARPLASASIAARCHDLKLRRERPAELQQVLVVMLEDEAWCTAACAILPALAARYPGAAIDVLCRAEQAGLFATRPELRRILAAQSPEAGADFASFDLHVYQALMRQPWQQLVLLGRHLDDPIADGWQLDEYLALQAGVQLEPVGAVANQGKPELIAFEVPDLEAQTMRHQRLLCDELAHPGDEANGEVYRIFDALANLPSEARELCQRALALACADRGQSLSEQRYRQGAYQGASCQDSPQS